MTTPPAHPKIYHITHVDNLGAIIAAGELVSDATMIARGGPRVGIGMSSIKGPRLTIPVGCHPAIMVGNCVPFNYCPRSVMLGIISYANHPELAYRGGQGPIVHLQSDLEAVVRWADDEERQCAITLSNARASYCEFRDELEALAEVDWNAVRANDWRAQTSRSTNRLNSSCIVRFRGRLWSV